MNYLLQKSIKKTIGYFPKYLYPIYSRWQGEKLKHLKLSKGIVAISFDNDYSVDNEAAEKLLPLFKEYQTSITWAVVGLWIQKYGDLHKKFLDAGHELMNHSWSHPDNAELRAGDKRKFDCLSDAEIEFEITRAHEFCLERLGYCMKGFRMPHFRKHPAISKVLRKLDYKYTSNHFALNSPSFGHPYITCAGWVEIPLSCIPRRPERILETYYLYRGPDGLFSGEEQFFHDFCEMLRFTEKHKLITCMYFDACDIIRLSSPKFSKYLEVLLEANVQLLTLGKVAEILLRNNGN